MFITLKGTLSSDVSPNGTVDISLPTNGNALSAFQAAFPVTSGDFLLANNSRLTLNGGDSVTSNDGFSVTLQSASTVRLTNIQNGIPQGSVAFASGAQYPSGTYVSSNSKIYRAVNSGVSGATAPSHTSGNASDGTITWAYVSTLNTWKAGSTYVLQLEMLGYRYYQDNDPNFNRKLIKAVDSPILYVNLGMPVAASANSVLTALTGALNQSGVVPNGALSISGVAYLDVPRNVTAVSNNAADTSVLQISGTDQYGQPMRENLTLNGVTSVVGKKAFSTVTKIQATAALTGSVTVGHGNVLGLPVFLTSSAFVLKEMQDSAAAAAGTFVAGARVPATGVTADVRGTYTPAVAPDGTKTYHLVIVTPDAGQLGLTQF